MAMLGLVLTLLWVKDTRTFVQKEAQRSTVQDLGNVFWATTLRDRTLSSVTQAGMVNNLNDGMIWGLLPMLLLTQDYDSARIGVVAAIYPAVWGVGQLFTGRMADIYPRKTLLFWGMLLQGLTILAIPLTVNIYLLATLAILLGLGTALVYPTFLAAIADGTHPQQRAESIGVFRLWRDLGYAIGALLAGLVADWLGISVAVFLIGALTVLSAWIIQVRMPTR
jgi:MFS family permease